MAFGRALVPSSCPFRATRLRPSPASRPARIARWQAGLSGPGTRRGRSVGPTYKALAVAWGDFFFFSPAARRAIERSTAPSPLSLSHSPAPAPRLLRPSPNHSYNEREYRYVAEQVWTFERTFDVSLAMLEHKQVRAGAEAEGRERKTENPLSIHPTHTLTRCLSLCLSTRKTATPKTQNNTNRSTSSSRASTPSRTSPSTARSSPARRTRTGSTASPSSPC
jgi:hypothetical protein